MEETKKNEENAEFDKATVEADDQKAGDADTIFEQVTENKEPSTGQDKSPGSSDDGNFYALKTIQTGIEQLGQDFKSLAESSSKTTGEIREMHKLYHNEYANRLKSMQDELERYREIDKGKVFDGILTEIAKMYSDNVAAVDGIADGKIKKQFHYMFLDMLQILENNGVLKQKSKPGDKRNTRHCQVIERISTDDQTAHDTVVKSINTGFFIENRTLVKEMVHVFIYDKKREDKEETVEHTEE